MMRNFNFTVMVSVDTDDDQHAAQCVTHALGNLVGSDIGSFKVLATRKQEQIPALFRAKKGIPHDRNTQC